MDIEKLQKNVDKLEKAAGAISQAAAATSESFESDAKARDSARQAMRSFATTLKEVLMDFLKSRKEPVRPGQIYRDAAAKNFVPGDLPGDPLLVKWGGNVTPSSARDVHEEAGRLRAVADKLIPVLKAYRKNE